MERKKVKVVRRTAFVKRRVAKVSELNKPKRVKTSWWPFDSKNK